MFCEQFEIKFLLNIQQHFNCVTTLPCVARMHKILKKTNIDGQQQYHMCW